MQRVLNALLVRLDEKGVLFSMQSAIKMNYDGKTFGMLSTSTGALGNVVFHYHQRGDVVWGTFEGDGLALGVFAALADAQGGLDLRYAFIVEGGGVRTGVSLSTPEVLADGRVRLHEDFYFTSGDQRKGISVVEELPIHNFRLPNQSEIVNRKSKIHYAGKRFVPVVNASNGEVTGDTIFDYYQRGDGVWATYEGGAIRKGMLVAVVGTDGALDMRYQHVNAKGEIMTGECRSTPEVLADGRLRLHESWQWTSGDRSNGMSVVEEIT